MKKSSHSSQSIQHVPHSANAFVSSQGPRPRSDHGRAKFANARAQAWRSAWFVLCLGFVWVSSALGQAPAAEQNSPAEAPFAARLNLEVKDSRFSDATGHEKDATLANILQYAREKLHQNIVLGPGIGGMRIDDLTLRNADTESFFQALVVAGGMEIEAHPISSGHGRANTWAVVGRRRVRKVEVFNMSGYLQQSATKDPAKALADLKQIIFSTAKNLKRPSSVQEEEASFEFHPGANLFIVIGSEDLIEVARKVVSALPGARLSGMNSPDGPGLGLSRPGPKQTLPGSGTRDNSLPQ